MKPLSNYYFNSVYRYSFYDVVTTRYHSSVSHTRGWYTYHRRTSTAALSSFPATCHLPPPTHSVQHLFVSMDLNRIFMPEQIEVGRGEQLSSKLFSLLYGYTWNKPGHICARRTRTRYALYGFHRSFLTRGKPSLLPCTNSRRTNSVFHQLFTKTAGFRW